MLNCTCRLRAAQYEMAGASRRYGTSCSYDFFSNRITKTGAFFSPLYPQNYPPFSRCQYAFHALPGEVVRLHFNSIRLDKSAQHKCAVLRVVSIVNPLIPTLKPQSNGPLYRNTVIGTLAVDGWAVTFDTARMVLDGLEPRPVPSSLYQMQQPTCQRPLYQLHINSVVV